MQNTRTNGKKQPLPPGCVDQQLAGLSMDAVHDEVDIPPASENTPNALQSLLNVYSAQYMNMMNQMKSPEYKDSVEKMITEEKERNQRLQNRATQLEKEIKVLIDDSVALLKPRMIELGINATSPVDLFVKAKEILWRHKDLRADASKLQAEVFGLEQEQKNLQKRHREITEKYAKHESRRELSPLVAEECISREIPSTLSHRKKLHNQVSLLEGEVMNLKKTCKERKKAQTMTEIRQQQQSLSKVVRKSRDYRTRSRSLAKIEEQNPEILAQKILKKGPMIKASKLSNTSKIQQKVNSNSKQSGSQNSSRSSMRSNIPTPVTVSLLKGEVMNLEKTGKERKKAQTMSATRQQQQHSLPKVTRKSRDYRTRSQGWPDVPDIAKIEEQNPEILPQKILKKGPMIKASKLSNTSKAQQQVNSNSKQSGSQNSLRRSMRNIMPAPVTVSKELN